MKIDGLDPRPASSISGSNSGPIDARPATVGRDTVATGGEAARRSDPIAITSDAQALNEAAERISQTPEVNQARVEAVRSALERGEYVVDATRVAERILELEESF